MEELLGETILATVRTMTMEGMMSRVRVEADLHGGILTTHWIGQTHQTTRSNRTNWCRRPSG